MSHTPRTKMPTRTKYLVCWAWTESDGGFFLEYVLMTAEEKTDLQTQLERLKEGGDVTDIYVGEPQKRPTPYKTFLKRYAFLDMGATADDDTAVPAPPPIPPQVPTATATHEVAIGWAGHRWNLLEVKAPIGAPAEDIEAAARRMIEAQIDAFPQQASSLQVAFIRLYHRATATDWQRLPDNADPDHQNPTTREDREETP